MNDDEAREVYALARKGRQGRLSSRDQERAEALYAIDPVRYGVASRKARDDVDTETKMIVR